jgi:tRNA 2-selenouridine synthase
VVDPLEYAADHPPRVGFPQETTNRIENIPSPPCFCLQQQARIEGASYISEHISYYLRSHFSQKPKTYRPLIYCWRGGNRSRSLALVLATIGWSVTTVVGGYKAYRRHVLHELNTRPLKHKFIVLRGKTGTGKTRLLKKMGERPSTFQVLDLEYFANHKGSVLGRQTSPQPGQRMFESSILDKLMSFSEDRPVWVEGESNKIGELYVPPVLYKQIASSPYNIELCLPLHERINLILDDYKELLQNPEDVKIRLQSLKQRVGSGIIQHWLQLIAESQWQELVASLFKEHYDPKTLHYWKSHEISFVEQLNLNTLNDDEINKLLDYLQVQQHQLFTAANSSKTNNLSTTKTTNS